MKSKEIFEKQKNELIIIETIVIIQYSVWDIHEELDSLFKNYK